MMVTKQQLIEYSEYIKKEMGNNTEEQRDNTIEEVLSYNGLSVIIKNEEQFKHIQKFLGEDVLYLSFVPQMATRDTGIIIWSTDEDFSTGSVGCAEYQRKHFFRTVEFNDFFKLN